MKQVIANYTFNATAKTVTLTDFSTVRLDRLQLIVNTTTNTILYNFADNSIASATVATNVITLSTVGSSASSDKLQIVYDSASGDPTYDALPVTAASLPLPAGGATAANQSTANSSLASIDTKTPSLVSGRVPVDGSGVTQPVSASSLPLPAGAAQDATLTGGTLQGRITDGINVANVGAVAGRNGLYVMPNSNTGGSVPATAYFLGVQSLSSTVIPVRSAASAGSNNGGDNELATVSYGQYNTSQPSITAGNFNPVQLTQGGVQKVAVYDPTGANLLTQQVDTNGDGAGAAVFMQGMANRNFLFNGSSFDRQRANTNVTTGDTGAKTATFNGATQTNHNAAGATIVINMGTVSGTSPTLIAKIQGSADGGTTWFDVPGAVTPTISASGQYLLHVYPGVTPVANAAVSFPLPRTWRLVYTIGGTTPSFTLTNVQVAYTL